MTAVERAAELINEAWDAAASHWPGDVAAQALADAGLLITDEDRAVLDAADASARHRPRTDVMTIPIYDYAIRYCLTRQSYAYEDGLQLANDHWDELSDSTQRDVLDAIARGWVDPSRYPRLDHEIEHRLRDDD